MIPSPFSFNPSSPEAAMPYGRYAGQAARPLLVRRIGAFTADAPLWFRPIHRLDGGAVFGADLVTRPDHPDGSAAPAEHARLLLHEAGRQASLADAPLTLSLPLPRGLACDAGLVRHAEAALRIWSPEPCTVELVLNEPDTARAGAEMLLALSALRDVGIGLALACGADVELGLAGLRRLPLSCLRLPAVIVRDLPHSRPARQAASRAIDAALAYDATVMAQGVRTAAQRDILADLGCDTAQGTLFGHPMPAAIFQAALVHDMD